MKNHAIKKIALGLAATSIVNITTGCSSSKKDVSIPKTATIVSENAENVYKDYNYYTGGTAIYKGQEYKEAHDPSIDFVINEYTGISYENGLKTSSLYFVRIDSKIYLATKLTDINENNIISKYYDIGTGEFLGQSLDVNWYARAAKEIDTIMPPGSTLEEYKVSVSDDLKDNNYFNGEYGLGKNLCRENIINAKSVFSEKSLTKGQIDSLLTDPLLTSSIVERYNYPGFITYSKEDYTFIPLRYSADPLNLITASYTAGFNGEISYYSNYLLEFTVDDGDNIRKVIGYRASTNKEDSGYNYIYDVESSSYLNLSQFKVLDIKKVVGSITIGEIRKKLAGTSAPFYSIEDLKVLSTLNLEGDDTFEKYYISMRPKHAMGDIYEYEILGENELVSLFGNFDGTKLCITKRLSKKSTPEGTYDGIMILLKKCLETNGLSNYIKETYTEEELSNLLIKLRDKELDLGTPLSETVEYYKKINIKDIVVVDTSIENDNSTQVLVESEKKYYVLIPDKSSYSEESRNSDVIRYKICDKTGSAAISFKRRFIIIDNIAQTFYSVLKTDGELECVTSLESILRELGLDEYIREEYALIDLQGLAEKINKNSKTLTFN